MTLRCNSNKKEKIRLSFYPCKNIGENKIWKELCKVEPLVVYETDWVLLLSYFYKVFPAINPQNGEIQESFDHCRDDNWIGKNDWQNIIMDMKKHIPSMKSDDEIIFVYRFIKWIEKQLDWADIIVVDSNQ
jgi:hypothetical protein